VVAAGAQTISRSPSAASSRSAGSASGSPPRSAPSRQARRGEH